MIRILNAYFPARTLLLLLSEAILAYSALLGMAYVKFGSDSGLMLFYDNGWIRLAIISVVSVLCLYYYDLYNSIIVASNRELITRLVQVVGTTCIILAVLYYLVPSIQIRTSLFVPAVIFMGLCLLGWRQLFARLARSSRLSQRTVLMGDGPLAALLAHEIQTRPELGLRLIGYLGQPSDSRDILNGMSRIGCIPDVEEIARSHEADRVIVTMNERRAQLPVDRLLDMKTRGVLIEDGNAFYETLTGKVALESLRPSQLLFSSGFFASRSMLLYKRVSSLALSLICLIAMLPVMVLIAIAIYIDSGKSILFRQKRVGKDGQIFTLYKFRSMRVHANVNADGNVKSQPAQKDDERFTRVGRWIRRLRVDELPQLYNILKGDMSFVGPRPFMVEEERELAQQIPFYKHRWTVSPGATGWAQVHRAYCTTLEDNREKLSYDLFYIKNMSVGLDLLIFFETVKVLIWRRGSR
jgi:sugar transferase (PEP-CTERM system associated)